MMDRRGRLFVLSAPSGAGKSTLIKAVQNRLPGIGFSVSHTTREPRRGEEDGVHYHFVTREKFMSLVEEGAFVEWAEVHGNLYGTSKAALEKELSRGFDVILDIDVQGALQVAKKMPEAVKIFILPPSINELQRRLTGRGKDSAEVIARRINNAIGEIEHASHYDFAVVNDNFEEALTNLEAVIRAKRVENVARLPVN